MHIKSQVKQRNIIIKITNKQESPSQNAPVSHIIDFVHGPVFDQQAFSLSGALLLSVLEVNFYEFSVIVRGDFLHLFFTDESGLPLNVPGLVVTEYKVDLPTLLFRFSLQAVGQPQYLDRILAPVDKVAQQYQMAIAERPVVIVALWPHL